MCPCFCPCSLSCLCPSYLVASSACRGVFVIIASMLLLHPCHVSSFEITELTPQTRGNNLPSSCARVLHQRLKEEAGRGKRTTRSAHTPVSRPSVPRVHDFACEPAVAAGPHGRLWNTRKCQMRLLVSVCSY